MSVVISKFITNNALIMQSERNAQEFNTSCNDEKSVWLWENLFRAESFIVDSTRGKIFGRLVDCRWLPVTTPLLLAGRRRLRYVHRLSSACTGYKECTERTRNPRVVVVFLTLIRHAVVIVGSKYTRRHAAASQAAIFLASKNGGKKERKKGQAARTGTGSSFTALRIARLPSTINLTISKKHLLCRVQICALLFPFFSYTFLSRSRIYFNWHTTLLNISTFVRSLN